jgi:hypothetical protein
MRILSYYEIRGRKEREKVAQIMKEMLISIFMPTLE